MGFAEVRVLKINPHKVNSHFRGLHERKTILLFELYVILSSPTNCLTFDTLLFFIGTRLYFVIVFCLHKRFKQSITQTEIKMNMSTFPQSYD